MSARHFCDRCGTEIGPTFARYSARLVAQNQWCCQRTYDYEDLCGPCAAEVLCGRASPENGTEP